MNTEHALDWSKTIGEIEDQIEQMAKERERCVLALLHIRDRLRPADWEIDGIITRTLRGNK